MFAFGDSFRFFKIHKLTYKGKINSLNKLSHQHRLLKQNINSQQSPL